MFRSAIGLRSTFAAGLAAAALAAPSAASADIVGFGGDGQGYTLNGGATASSDVLTVTDGGQYQARSAFYNTRQDITSFTASFVYRASGDRASDGMAFVLQNDPAGASALGGMGGALGYGYMAPSAAIELNLYEHYGVGTNFRTDGQTYVYNPTGDVNIAGGDPILIELAYDGATLTQRLTDLATGASYSTAYEVDLANVLGGETAFVGFTGGTGGTSSIQTVSNFRFDSRVGAVPEPASLSLIGIGFCGIMLLRRMKAGFSKSK